MADNSNEYRPPMREEISLMQKDIHYIKEAIQKIERNIDSFGDKYVKKERYEVDMQSISDALTKNTETIQDNSIKIADIASKVSIIIAAGVFVYQLIWGAI